MKITDMVFAGIITALLVTNTNNAEAQTRKNFQSKSHLLTYYCSCELTSIETFQPITVSFRNYAPFGVYEAPSTPAQEEQFIKFCNEAAASRGVLMTPKHMAIKDCQIKGPFEMVYQ